MSEPRIEPPSERTAVPVAARHGAAGGLVRAGGSLYLALVLLPLLALSLFLGTLMESWHEIRAAHQLVYGTWWFRSLLGLLAANVFLATLKKRPWRRRHIGFLVTHAGLLTLIAGGFLSGLLGVSGLVVLIDSEHPRALPLGTVRSSTARDDFGEMLRIETEGTAQEFPFPSGPLAWQSEAEAGRRDWLTRALACIATPWRSKPTWPLLEGGQLTVLDFVPHARSGEPLRPVFLPLGHTASGIAPAVRCRLAHGNANREFWLPQTEAPFHEVELAGVHYTCGYHARTWELPFTLELVRAEQTTDPGSHLPASQTSWLRLTDPEHHLDRAPRTLTLNQPLTHRGYRIYLAGFETAGASPAGIPIQQVSLRVTLDPGLELKYLGACLVSLGIVLMYALQAARGRPAASPNSQP